MPVAHRFSRQFYERLGEAVVNELVDWFTAVEAGYQGELRALNEVNFTRFDARLEQRMAGLEARLEVKFEQRMAGLEAKLDKEVGILNSRIDVMGAELREALERGLKEQTRWMFVAWGSLLIPIIGLWLRR